MRKPLVFLEKNKAVELEWGWVGDTGPWAPFANQDDEALGS